AVVVGGRRGDHVEPTVVDAEDQPAVIGHVDVLVVVAARAGLRVSEADQLATAGRGGVEPQLQAVPGRSTDLVRGDHVAGAAVEGRRVPGAAERAGRPLGDAT